MLKWAFVRALRRRGYDLYRIPAIEPIELADAPPAPPPVWPLPRAGGLSDDRIREAFARHPHWHYAYAFEGGLSFPAAHNRPGPDTNTPVRPLQRFRHFMPFVIDAAGGTLRGKRILDIGCNSGFWSIQCALLGAEVVGFDARPELIAQADLLKRITGAASAEFRVLDFWQMSPEALGGTFDVVLNLGVLYHLAEPLKALELTKAMSRGHILLDTAIYPSQDLLVQLKWETPFDIRTAAREGIVALPSAASVELMLRHIGASAWARIRVRSTEMPDEYLTGHRASWLVEA